jgi:hypothetical protein
MLVTELQIEHLHVRSLMVRLVHIVLRVCGLFVRLRPAP